MVPGMTTSFETESIPTSGLYGFIERYLSEMEKIEGWNPPSEDRILDACGDLKRLLGETPCTPLLASMWAREISAEEGKERPQGVAALMDSYVRRVLMPAAGGDEGLVARLTKDAAQIAELELSENYLPGSVTRASALDVLRELDPKEPEHRFGVMAKSRLLESPSPDSDIAHIAPDPIAEHLVARLRTEGLKSDHEGWTVFLAHIREVGSPTGFVAALGACAGHEVYGTPIPKMIAQQIRDLQTRSSDDGDRTVM
jgi:hypothetical protein